MDTLNEKARPDFLSAEDLAWIKSYFLKQTPTTVVSYRDFSRRISASGNRPIPVFNFQGGSCVDKSFITLNHLEWKEEEKCYWIEGLGEYSLIRVLLLLPEDRRVENQEIVKQIKSENFINFITERKKTLLNTPQDKFLTVYHLLAVESVVLFDMAQQQQDWERQKYLAEMLLEVLNIHPLGKSSCIGGQASDIGHFKLQLKDAVNAQFLLFQFKSELSAYDLLSKYQGDILSGKLSYPTFGAMRTFLVKCLDSKDPTVQLKAASILQATGYLWHLSEPAGAYPPFPMKEITDKVKKLLS